ncbi:hypothetical protein JYU34_013883, partial [Plutella xylostella]
TEWDGIPARRSMPTATTHWSNTAVDTIEITIRATSTHKIISYIFTSNFMYWKRRNVS